MKRLYLVLLLFSILFFVGCKSQKELYTTRNVDNIEVVQKIDSTKTTKVEEVKTETKKEKEATTEKEEKVEQSAADSIIIIEKEGETITKIYKPNKTIIDRKQKDKDKETKESNTYIANRSDSFYVSKTDSLSGTKIKETSDLKQKSEPATLFSTKVIIGIAVLLLCLFEIFSKGTLTKLLIKMINYIKQGLQSVTNAL